MTEQQAITVLTTAEKRLREVTILIKGNDSTVDDLLAIDSDIKKYVSAIESSIPTTQNHYGSYLQLLSEANDLSLSMLIIWKHGANPVGLLTAFHILMQ